MSSCLINRLGYVPFLGTAIGAVRISSNLVTLALDKIFPHKIWVKETREIDENYLTIVNVHKIKKMDPKDYQKIMNEVQRGFIELLPFIGGCCTMTQDTLQSIKDFYGNLGCYEID